MCGIVGVVNLSSQSPVSREGLHEANQSMLRRGPDDSGMYLEAGVGLAARRLRIIDLEGGSQPVSNEDNTVHIVYNGEIYTHEELRQELRSLGHRFRSRSDTEVVVHAYEEWGIEGCLERLQGMYAFSLWDSVQKVLYVVRDRMGIKPLYHLTRDGCFYFSSTIRALLLLSKAPRAVNLSALEAFMQLGLVTSPETLFEGVEKLPPAHYLTVRDGRVSIHRYWVLTYETTALKSEQEYIDEFYQLLCRSIGLRLNSDVPLGTLLSGGIDSTALAAIMQQQVHSPVQTVSMGFHGGIDETAFISANAKALGTDHHHSAFSGDSLDGYPRALYHMEEPLADAVFMVFYHLYQVCDRAGLRVVLNGEGADELLGGYFWHRGDRWALPFLDLPYPLRAMIAASPLVGSRGDAGRRMADVLKAGPKGIEVRYQTWLGNGGPGRWHSLFSDQVRASLETHSNPSLLQRWADYLSPATGNCPLNQMLWIQSRTRLCDRSNHLVDRMSMAHSIEARVPFQDHKLWEFCARLPSRLKIHGSYARPVEKYILREAVRGLIPEETRTRKKKGLVAPFAAWLAQPRLPEWAEAALSETGVRRTALFDAGAVFRLRREHQSGAPDRATLLMAVLAIQVWDYLFLQLPVTSSEPAL